MYYDMHARTRMHTHTHVHMPITHTRVHVNTYAHTLSKCNKNKCFKATERTQGIFEPTVKIYSIVAGKMWGQESKEAGHSHRWKAERGGFWCSASFPLSMRSGSPTCGMLLKKVSREGWGR